MEFIYQEEDKQRLDKYLPDKLDITRSQIKKLILSGQILVNDKAPTVHHWLKPGDKIFYQPKEVEEKNAEFPAEPKIVDENNEFIVLEKPSNMLSHPTDKGEINTMADWVMQKFPQAQKIGEDPNRPSIVHRLDREVSGLMVIPLTQDSFDSLKRQFADRTVRKEYTALVHGQLINDQGEINQPLERDKKTGLMKVQSGKEAGKIALTTYQIIKRFVNYTLVKVQIKTGRMHQIRAHFYSIGHSIVGDKLYQTKDIRKKKKVLDQRIFLHCTFLKFKDLEGNWHEYKSPLPHLLDQFLNKLK
ncbi:RluA family pseudouridine synthase [Patescibacteria group bacterium]|nr:RluA family pseudouridine synthase [Patescibacteria group bacterium]